MPTLVLRATLFNRLQRHAGAQQTAVNQVSMFSFHHTPKVTPEEEKTAIRELAERLRDGTQPVEEQLLQGGEAGMQSLDDITLARWLRAENNVVDKAEKRLRAHAIWRRDEFPEGRVLETEIKDELASGKCFLQGHDKYGRAVILLQVKKHSRSLRDLRQCMRFLCYGLDKAINAADKTRNPSGKVTGIFDLEGISMDSIDNAALRGVFDMLQSHYPERLGHLWMYESPSIFWILWKAVSPFIDPVTKKKVIFVSGSTAVDQMTAEIDIEILPESVGGKGKLVRIEDAKVSGPQEAKDTANHPLVEPSVQAKSLQRIPQPASVGPASSGQSTEKEEGTILAPRGPNNTPLVQQGRILYCGLPCRGYHKLNQPGGKWRLFSAQGRQETSRRIPLFQSIP